MAMFGKTDFSKKIALIGFGITANSALVYLSDYLIYPFIIWKLGLLKGGLLNTFISFIFCFALLLFYDWSKTDWLGLETLKYLKEYAGQSKIGKMVAWFLTKSNVVAMFFLSIKFDPFITTAYMRRGSFQYNGMSKRDWKIFFSSLVISNLYWSLAAFMGVTLLEYCWKQSFK